jgi:hypothetical protein
MTNKFLLYADSIEENLSGACRPTVFPGSFAAGGGYTPFFAVNAPPGFNIGALLVVSTATLVASATCASTASTDTLDLITAGYNVSDAPNADARCRTVDRAGVEEVERLLCAPGNTGSGTFFTYPRTGASTTATGTNTYTGQFVIPCGEPTDAVQVQFKTPSLNTVFTSGVTSISITYTVYVIPSVNPATIAFVESPLPSYGASAVVPVEQYQPTNIAPDIVDFVGKSPSVFAQVQAYDTNGAELVNQLDTSTMQAVQYGWPGAASSTASTIINVKGARMSRLAATLGSTSETLTVLWIQVSGQPTAGPTEGHDQTPSPPATQKVGTSVPGTIASAPASGGGSKNPFRRANR